MLQCISTGLGVRAGPRDLSLVHKILVEKATGAHGKGSFLKKAVTFNHREEERQNMPRREAVSLSSHSYFLESP